MTEDRWAEMRRLMTNAAFARQIAGDARRHVWCHPDQLDAWRARIEELGLAGTVTVQASLAAPDDKAIIVDTAAMEASQRQFDQQMLNPRSEFWQRFNR